MESRGRLEIRIHAAQRYIVWHYLQPILKNIRVMEFPKSGGTWLSQMLSALFELPYPRNSALPYGRCIQHEHFTNNKNYKTIHLIRDGRDVMTSAYFHFLIADNKRPPHLLKKWRDLVSIDQYEDAKSMMPRFIKIFNSHYKVGGTKMKWSEFVMQHQSKSNNIIIVKYENLLSDTKEVLSKICDWYQYQPHVSYDDVVNQYKFENQSKRIRGQEDKTNFLRKGIAGDWKNYFNDEAKMIFNDLHGEALKYHGYD